MHREIIVKGRSLGGCSDLTLLAPIKPGFVESLESATYKTRIKRVLETLHGARATAYEYSTARLLSDSIERVGAIQSVRVAVLEPEDKVLLAVTFDGSWESYIRVLWDKVGTLLDLIFCGTVDYVTAYDHTFDEWLGWARRVQVETGFFYGPPDSTARDALYQRRVERMRVRGTNELDQLRTVLPSAEKAVERLANPPNPPQADDPQIRPVGAPRMVRERIRSGLQGLATLYRLTDLHRPGTPDGNVLREAALDLLAEFVRIRNFGLITTELKEQHARFERQLDWLFPTPGKVLKTSHAIPPPAADESRPLDKIVDLEDVQGGILRPYDNLTHGLVLMLAFDGAHGARTFLDWLDGKITSGADQHDADKTGVLRNIGFTLAGLRVAGLDEDTLELFPEEFRQGMAARAGLLGDLRNNHPRRWRLPRRFDGLDAAPGNESIELDGVHAVLHLRCSSPVELTDSTHPFRSDVQDLTALGSAVRLLAVQPLQRRYVPRDGGRAIADHFGYADGDGQPEVEPKKDQQAFKRNRIHPGEILLGYDNAADKALDPADARTPAAAKTRLRWLANGSFLVMRKYRQFTSRIEEAVARTAQVMKETLGEAVPPVDYSKIVYSKLMGRERSGTPLIPVVPGQLNLFTYDQDRNGKLCPLQAHIRLAHPRMPTGDAARPPRLMRRSMSYGPERVPGEGDEDTRSIERGLVFMAYNASLGEQFEVVQRWLAGGNSTGSSSGQSCPIVGVPENGLARQFRFEHTDTQGESHVFRVELESNIDLFETPPVLTQLEWGMYLFTPSLRTLRSLLALSAGAAHNPMANVPWQALRGRQQIAALRHLETTQGQAAAVAAWKSALEDPEAIDRLDSASLWASIRDDHGGVLKTPYGVLVASRELISEVFDDRGARYSLCGQRDRMKRSFGDIFLGMDESPEYRKLATEVNNECMALEPEDVFELTRNAALDKIDKIVGDARKQSHDVADARFEVGVDAREVLDEVLAEMCEAWFGLADPADAARRRFRRGGTDWSWQDGQLPLYPGHFTALSRYMFQPNPGPMVAELGEAYGRGLRDAMALFVADHRPPRRVPKDRTGKVDAPIAAAIFNHPSHGIGKDDGFVTRTMVGVMMGFIAPVIGAVSNVLREWQRDGQLGALRAQLAGTEDYARAREVLGRPMMAAARMRPMPQIVWRTAVAAHRFGPPESARRIDVEAGEKLVLGLVSGTQQSLADGEDDDDDRRLMFGGKRAAAEPSTCPTHACPGHAAGLAAMLGTLTALLTWADLVRPAMPQPAWPSTMRPGSIPLTLLFEGATWSKQVWADVQKEQAAMAKAAEEAEKAAKAGAAARKNPIAKGSKGLVLAWGDSWLDHSYREVSWGTDLRDCLDEAGYTVPEDFCQYPIWLKARYLADNPEEFCDYLDSVLLSPNKPLAILLSAGGNDSTGDTLKDLLNEKAPAQPVLNADACDKHIDGLRDGYVRILSAIKRVLDDHDASNIPIIVHGYDHPIPAGHSAPGRGDYAKRWLYDPFTAKKYVLDKEPGDKAAAAQAMRDLIDRLNDMLHDLANDASPGRGFKGLVRYVDLRGTIQPGQAGDVAWFDDLHPTSAAFKVLASKIAAEIPRREPEGDSSANVPASGATPSA